MKVGAMGSLRRGLLAGAAALGSVAALAACGTAPGAGPGGRRDPGAGHDQALMWDYNPQIVRENLDQSSSAEPRDQGGGPGDRPCWRRLPQADEYALSPASARRDVHARRGRRRMDRSQVGAAPGQHARGQGSDKDEYPFVTEQTNYKGKKYGTIYYVGPAIAFYNKETSSRPASKPAGHLGRVPHPGGADQAPDDQRCEFPATARRAKGDREPLSRQRQADVRRRPAAHLRQGRLFKDTWRSSTRRTRATRSSATTRWATAFDNGKASLSWGTSTT